MNARNLERFLDAMHDENFSKNMENNEYNTTECIICMEDFKEGILIK